MNLGVSFEVYEKVSADNRQKGNDLWAEVDSYLILRNLPRPAAD